MSGGARSGLDSVSPDSALPNSESSDSRSSDSPSLDSRSRDSLSTEVSRPDSLRAARLDPDALPPSPFRASMAAVSPEGIIGVAGGIPWDYPGDRRRLWRLTKGRTIVLGRLTWESLPRRPMRDRRNLVVAGAPVPGAETFGSVRAALETCAGEDVWFLGGTRIYAEAMEYADFLDITEIPDRIGVRPGETVARFPPIDRDRWEAGPVKSDPEEPGVRRRRHVRREGRDS